MITFTFTFTHIQSLMPHGQCWLWDTPLVLGIAIGNLLIVCAYMLIPIIGWHIYHQGNLNNLRFAYPQLWRSGLLFVALCGLSHLIQVIEIWVGGWTYYIDATVVIVTGIASLWFVYLLWRARDEIVVLAILIKESMEIAHNGE